MQTITPVFMIDLLLIQMGHDTTKSVQLVKNDFSLLEYFMNLHLIIFKIRGHSLQLINPINLY